MAYIYGENNMQNKKWKKFNKLTAKCYNNMIGAEADGNWQREAEKNPHQPSVRGEMSVCNRTVRQKN